MAILSLSPEITIQLELDRFLAYVSQDGACSSYVRVYVFLFSFSSLSLCLVAVRV